jgi:hypothetical protein
LWEELDHFIFPYVAGIIMSAIADVPAYGVYTIVNGVLGNMFNPVDLRDELKVTFFRDVYPAVTAASDAFEA